MSGGFCEWYYSDVAPAKHNLIYENCSTARPLYGDGGSWWAIVVGLVFCKIARKMGFRDFGDGSDSSKKTMATGGHMETDAGPTRI